MQALPKTAAAVGTVLLNWWQERDVILTGSEHAVVEKKYPIFCSSEG
jgi:hypothetical protein